LERILLARIGDPAQQANIRFMAYLLSQEADALKPDPVENFGAREAIISMHASTRNTNCRSTQSLGGD